MHANQNKPLAGIRVLDVSQAASGPMCAAWLAALGATVIKIERPGTGDMARRTPPYASATGLAARPGGTAISSTVLKRNRDKQSVALDLQHPEGARLLCELVKSADVFLENFKPGATARLGIDYDSLKPIKPDLVYCSITGFGLSGPYKDWMAFDTIIQGMTGVMATTGETDGPPTKAGLIVGDTYSPLFALSGILAALRQRDRTGEGQFIEVSMFDCLAALVWDEPIEFYVEHGIKGRSGNRFLRMAPWNTYPATDGHVVICAGQQAHYHRVCELIGQPALVADPRFATMEDRLKNHDQLDAIVAGWTAARSRAVVVAACQEMGIPCGPVNELADLVRDPQLEARGMMKPLEHPTEGIVPGARAADFPVRFSGFSADHVAPAPVLGQHTGAVLGGDLGLSAERLAELDREGVIKLGG